VQGYIDQKQLAASAVAASTTPTTGLGQKRQFGTAFPTDGLPRDHRRPMCVPGQNYPPVPNAFPPTLARPSTSAVCVLFQPWYANVMNCRVF